MLFVTDCGKGGITNRDDDWLFSWADSAAGWMLVEGGAGTVRGTTVIPDDAITLLSGDRNSLCTCSRTIAAKSKETAGGIEAGGTY